MLNVSTLHRIMVIQKKATRISLIAGFLADSPKDTSVSVSPAFEVDAGTNITLKCSSHANPPVVTFVWSKIDDDILEVGRQPVLVSVEVGQYFCTASNKHGSQNSTVVTVRIKGELMHNSIPLERCEKDHNSCKEALPYM